MTLLMQLTDVAGKGRLEPVTAAVNAGEILHRLGQTAPEKHAAGSHGGADHRGRRDNPSRAIARRLATRYTCLPSKLPVQQQVPPFAMPVWHYLTLHLSDKNQVGLLNEVAAALGLDDKLTRQANQLSGGEWQRVRLAAVILQIHPAGNPHGRMLLLDEPMSGLDVAQQAALDTLLSALCRKGSPL